MSRSSKFLSKFREKDEQGLQLITTEVYGGAYIKKGGEEQMLTHGVLYNPNKDWSAQKALCGNVKNIVDDEVVWTKDRPTCSICARKWDKLKSSNPEYLRWN